MRIWPLVIVAGILGGAVGAALTWLELAGDRLGIEPLVQVETAAQPVAPAAGSNNSAAADHAQARVAVLGEEEFDFGSMERGATRKHVFVLKNEGQDSLSLSSGGTSCGFCTISSLSRQQVLPGETAEVSVEWTPQEFAANYRQTATIHTSDPTRPVVTLAIKGRVTQTLRAVPEDIALGNLSVSETRTATVRLYGYRDASLAVARHEFANDQTAGNYALHIAPLSAEELSQEKGAAGGILATLEIKPGLPLGPIRQTIRLVTNLADAPPVEIPINGKVVGDVSVLPARNYNEEVNILNLGLVRQDIGAKADLYLLIRGPHSGETRLSVGETYPGGILRATLGERTEVKAGAVYRQKLTLEIPPGSPPASHLGSMRMDDHRMGRVNIEMLNSTAERLIVYVQFAVQ